MGFDVISVIVGRERIRRGRRSKEEWKSRVGFIGPFLDLSPPAQSSAQSLERLVYSPGRWYTRKMVSSLGQAIDLKFWLLHNLKSDSGSQMIMCQSIEPSFPEITLAIKAWSVECRLIGGGRRRSQLVERCSNETAGFTRYYKNSVHTFPQLVYSGPRAGWAQRRDTARIPRLYFLEITDNYRRVVKRDLFFSLIFLVFKSCSVSQTRRQPECNCPRDKSLRILFLVLFSRCRLPRRLLLLK